MILDKFGEYLKDNTDLMGTSIKLYRKKISELIKVTDTYEPDIKQLNDFIKEKVRKRQPQVKYAIAYYLDFIGKKELKKDLIKAKVLKPEIIKRFLNKNQIDKIVNNLDKPIHKVFALLQYATGARASEIITIKKKNISVEDKIVKDKNDQILKIIIEGKGLKPRPIYLLKRFWAILEPYYNATGNFKKYLFINEVGLTYLNYPDRVERIYFNYWKAIKGAAVKAKLGNVSTHDLRRSFANSVRLKTKDFYKVQKALGHSNIAVTMKYFEDSQEEISSTMIDFQLS